MEFYQVIKKRRSVRELQSRAIPDDSLKRIVEAGLMAPSNDHLRDWEFVILQDQEEKENVLQFVKRSSIKQMENKNIANMKKKQQQEMYLDAMPKQYSMLSQSGCVILVFFKATSAIFNATSLNALNPVASVWCCIENILLSTAAEGLASSIRIPVGEEGAFVSDLVHTPKDYLLACYIGIGYPLEETVKIEQVVHSVESKMHFGKW